MEFWDGICLDLEFGFDSLTMTQLIFEELLILLPIAFVSVGSFGLLLHLPLSSQVSLVAASFYQTMKAHNLQLPPEVVFLLCFHLPRLVLNSYLILPDFGQGSFAVSVYKAQA